MAASVRDVGAFIESQVGSVTTYRLQKLAYYAQAWSLAWDGEPLFREVIKAWRDGPVCPELWHSQTRFGNFGNPNALTDEQKRTITAVIDFYNQMTDAQLIELTHREQPWRAARVGLAAHEKGMKPITRDAMRAYFGPLVSPDDGKSIPDAVKRGAYLLLEMDESEVEEMDVVAPVDGEAVTRWLETGEGDPWASEVES